MVPFNLGLFYFLFGLISICLLIPSFQRWYAPLADSITRFLRWKHRRYSLARIFDKQNVNASLDSIRVFAFALLFAFFLVSFFWYTGPVIQNYESHILEFVSVLITSSSVLIGFSRSAATRTTRVLSPFISDAPTLGALCIIASIASLILEGATLSTQAVWALQLALFFLMIEALIVVFA